MTIITQGNTMTEEKDILDSLFAGDIPVAETATFQLKNHGTGPLREKYRPQRFDEVIPTCSLTQLQNLIDNPGASKILLFPGPTGTGKTTCARIVARANVCLADNTLEKPCLECNNCQKFDNSFDVVEINAADKNKIENIRDLVDDFKYRPSNYKKKIYILDEVQRLTPAAQQVLLTELEDPKPYLLVILCTTDIDKIDKALIDRATTVTFKKVTPSLAGDVIKQIFEIEGAELPDEEMISSLYYQSEGSVRALLNNIQAYLEDGFEPTKYVELAVLSEFFKAINTSNWVSLNDLLKRKQTRITCVELRQSLESYVRACVLRTADLKDAKHLGKILKCILGEVEGLTPTAKYNHFVLKCLSACLQ